MLYFDGNVYRLHHEHPDHEPIVLYKIPPDTGGDGDGEGDDDYDWPHAGQDGEKYTKKCYYERRQLEIHHVNNSGDRPNRLILVIPFRSSEILGGDPLCPKADTFINTPNPNSLDLSKLMTSIEDQGSVYYEEGGDTTTIFYTEQYVKWDVTKSFWNGSFMN